MTNFALKVSPLPKLPGRIMDAAELALFLHVSPRTIRKLARRGRIPFYRVGSVLRFDSARVLELMAAESGVDISVANGV